MIVTAKPRIPFLWQFTAALSWSAILIQYYLIGAVFIFSLKKFIDNPAGVTFIISLPSIISLIVTPFCSFMSDRIWTRFGRRKPFLITSWAGCFTCIALFPLAPNIWILIGTFLLFNFFNDVGTGSNESLKQEIVPPRQRGTAAAIGQWMTNIAQLTFALVAVGRFDDYQYYAGLPIRGEQALYWGVSAALTMILLLVAFGVRETETPSKVRGQRFSFKNFFGALLNSNLWPVYILITGYAIGKAGLGPLGALLYTEQWGFSKQEMGLNMAIGGAINIFIIMLLGLFADKLPRLKTYKILILLSIFIEIFYFIYVEYILFDATPTLVELIVFGEMGSIVGILMGMIYFPLVYDYITRNELGTYAAGATIVDKVVHIITLNGVGLFITLWATFFTPPGGDMTRVAMDSQWNEYEVRELLLSPEPIGAIDDPANLSVEAWYGTNARFDDGTAFEIRLANQNSVDLDEKRKNLEGEYNRILADRNNADFLAKTTSDPDEKSQYQDETAAFDRKLATIRAEITQMEQELLSRAQAFEASVRERLQPHLLSDQGDITSARHLTVDLYRIPIKAVPGKKQLSRTLDALRLLEPELIDMIIVNENLQFFLEFSFPKDNSPSLTRWIESFENAAQPRIGEVLPQDTTALLAGTREAIQLTLRVIEDPINRHISPITRIVFLFMAPFTELPPPERRMYASARGLRDFEASPHARVANSSVGDAYAIEVTAVLGQNDDPYADTDLPVDPFSPSQVALAGLMGISPDVPIATRAEDVYRRTIAAAAANKLTVAGSDLGTGYTPPKFNYMSGYFWMIAMSIIGYIITLYFTHREAKGLIHKRGREESDAEAEAESANEALIKSGGEDRTRFYTPGYVPAKIGIILLGLGFMTAAFIQLGPKLTLFLTGESAQAVATRVAKERVGGEKVWYIRDADILEAKERYDRSFVFWNEYAFNLPDGVNVKFTAKAGKQLEPVHTIRDKDGLPHVVTVWYAPEDPGKVVMPYVLSTWFLPGILLIFGLIGVSIGSCLLYYARKPIAMPLLPPDATKD